MRRGRMLPFIVALAGIAMLAGCASTYGDDDGLSLNVQRSALRGAGDMTATVYLDRADEPDAERVAGIADGLYEFVGTGDLAALPLDVVEDRLCALVPTDYQWLVRQVLAVIVLQDVDVGERIGAANVERIEAFLDGVRTGAIKFRRAEPDAGSEAGVGTAVPGVPLPCTGGRPC